MNIPPDFSIVTPALNAESTINRTLTSVLSQSHGSIEYLIMDGLSKDNTVFAIPRNDERLIVQSERDLGIFDAMNKGIKGSRGDIVGIINSDDWYLPGTLNAVWEDFETSGADIVLGGVNVYKNDKLIETRLHSSTELIDHMVSHPAVFVKRKVYEEIGLFSLDYRVAADYDFLLKAFKKGYKFSSLQIPLAGYTLDGFSDSPRNRITSIGETELIRFRHKVVSKQIASNRFFEYSFKTILKRKNKLLMTFEFCRWLLASPNCLAKHGKR